jgi:hypothetical protein
LAKKNVGKIKIIVDEDSGKLEFDVKTHDDGNPETPTNGPFPTPIKDAEMIQVVVTNPCTWIKIGGTWRRICWGS